jgi:hypothetical protein
MCVDSHPLCCTPFDTAQQMGSFRTWMGNYIKGGWVKIIAGNAAGRCRNMKFSFFSEI